MVIDTFIRELLIIGSENFENVFIFGRAVGFFLFFAMIFVTVIFDLKPYPIVYKHIFMGFMIIRIFNSLIEFVYFKWMKNELRTQQLAYEMVENTQSDGLALIISGLFYFKESLWFGILNMLVTIPIVITELGDEASHCILLVIFATFYHLIDQRHHSVCELDNFRNLTKIERRSLHLTQFVNRLLPKHVSSYLKLQF